MAVQKIDLPTDTTLKDIAASLRAIAGFTAADLVTMKQVKAIVEGKKEKEVFTIGDQITVPWTDKATNVTYAAVMDVVHFGDVELKDGETTNAMFYSGTTVRRLVYSMTQQRQKWRQRQHLAQITTITPRTATAALALRQ